MTTDSNTSTTKGKQKSKLFEVVCRPLYNGHLLERREYLRCVSKEMLEKAIKRCFNLPTSEYFGYVNIEVTEIKSVPEIMELIINTLRRKKNGN